MITDFGLERSLKNVGIGLSDIGKGLTDISKGLVAAAQIQGSPITYNIVVTGDASPESVKNAVAEAVKHAKST